MKKILELLKDKTIIALLVIFFVVTTGAVTLVLYTMEKSSKVEIIDFSKLTQNEIIEWFDKELNSDENLSFTREFSEIIKKDNVISQSVKAGELINKDTKVEIVLSNGTDPEFEVLLPDFVKEKYTKAEIQKFFEDNKFIDVSYEYKTSKEDKDIVIDINVSGKVKRNALILVTLSISEDSEEIEVQVPDLTTRSLNDVKAWGSANNITIKVEYSISDKVAEGKIISQSVKEGNTIKGGSTIKIVVSSGKGIEVPDLVGKTFEYADKWSDDTGTFIKPIYVYHDTIKKGEIYQQNLKVGSYMKKGDIITIYISNGVDPDSKTVNIENFAGKKEADLLAQLKKLEVKYTKSTAYYSDTITKDLVLENTNGNIKLSQTVEYRLSLGKFNLNKTIYEGKTKSQIDSEVSSANSLKAGINYQSSAEYNNSISEGKVISCTIKEKNLNCIFSKGTKPSESVKNYIGLYAADVKNGSLITYNVIYDDNYKDGTTYGYIYEQSITSGTYDEKITITLRAYKGEEKKVAVMKDIRLYYSGSNSYEDTVNSLINSLGEFGSNLIIERVSIEGRGKGVIISLTVDGSPLSENTNVPISKIVRVQVNDCD